MSTASTDTPVPIRWLPADEFRALGFIPRGPEIDYGMRWGGRGDIRVSFAPHADRTGGFLYAHDPTSDRYLLLAAQTTQHQIEGACRELIAATAEPDGYLALAVLGHDPAAMSVQRAQDLLLHCLDRELGAYHQFIAASADAPAGFDAAFAVVVQRSARVSAEQLLLDAARTHSPGTGPVVVHYRLPAEAGWSGSIAGADLNSACTTTRQAVELARRHQLTLQATSVSHGRTTVAAARVPELGAAAPRQPLTVDAPAIDL